MWSRTGQPDGAGAAIRGGAATGSRAGAATVPRATAGLDRGGLGRRRVDRRDRPQPYGRLPSCRRIALRPEFVPYLSDNPGVMVSVPVGGMPPLESEMGQSLQMALDEGQTILAVETVGYHVDVDKPWHILEANEVAIDGLCARREGDAIQPGRDVIPASARVHDGAEIHGRLVLGENAVIGNRVVVRGDLWLGDGATVDNGAILEGPSVIGRQAIVRDYCLIGSHSSLGGHGIYGHRGIHGRGAGTRTLLPLLRDMGRGRAGGGLRRGHRLR